MVVETEQGITTMGALVEEGMAEVMMEKMMRAIMTTKIKFIVVLLRESSA